MTMTNRVNLRRHIGVTASWSVLGLALAFGSGEAMAQTAPAQATAVIGEEDAGIGQDQPAVPPP